jgi:hypothetical protein
VDPATVRRRGTDTWRHPPILEVSYQKKKKSISGMNTNGEWNKKTTSEVGKSITFPPVETEIRYVRVDAVVTGTDADVVDSSDAPDVIDVS